MIEWTKSYSTELISHHVRIQKVLSEGVQLNFDVFLCFLVVYEGREDPNANISGPSSARQRNAILMAFRWRADDGLTLNSGFVAL